MNIPKGPDDAPGRPCSRSARSGPAAVAARALWPVLPAVLLALAAAGCGQRGPLYLPDDRAPVKPAAQSEAPAATQASAAEEGGQADDPKQEEDDEETPRA